MDLTDSHKLLRDYADQGSEAAFRELVDRYIDLVYSAALRRVGGNAEAAEDVTQTVFTDLARKAPSLRGVDMLGGWLHRHTGFVAANFVRGEQRRQIREQEAAQMNALTDAPDALWQQLSPVLDETIDSLEPADRQAILLRFFERHDFRSIGATLGISDDAAQKRVSRALDKLKDLLARRGITLSGVLLGTLMAGKVVKAAPADLAAKVAGLALAGATAGAGLAVTLAKFANSLAFKISIAAIVAAIAAKLLLSSHSASPVETARQGNAGVPPIKTQTASTPDPNPQVAIAVAALQSSPPNTASNVLALTIVSADSGQPIPNVELSYDLWMQGQIKRQNPLHATASGTCEVPIPDGTTELILVSQADGFADTRLKWEPDHGQVIPAQYTLRVARAVPIGGHVEDPDGNPVAGAQVGFNNQPAPAVDAQIETADFSWPFWITATTDEQGRWQINRIGKETIKSIYGSASHPDFVGSEMVFAGRDPNAEKQLLSSNWVFSLRRAVIVRGIVQDTNGQPVSDAKVLVGHVGYAGSRTTNSEADGTFSVRGCEPGTNAVTAQARGYAGTTVTVDLTGNSNPIQLILKPGNLLKLKVVDPDGNPIPKATVWIDNFGPVNRGVTSAPPAQVDFRGSTDAEGRIEWDNAPDGNPTFDVLATGYMRSGISIPADGTEHVFTLQPGLTISGTVVDATTGRPIPEFRIVTGWPNWNPTDGSTNAEWSTLDRFWMTFGGGQFKHTYEEGVIGGITNYEFLFKFIASGYAPFITRVVSASERNVRFDIALTPASTTTVTVVLPDGEPATAATVGLVSPRAWLHLAPGGFSPEDMSHGYEVKTDEQGQFQLPPDPTILRVIAAASGGYAEATPAELSSDATIHLQRWGRLEGTFLSGGQPQAGQAILFQYARTNFDAISSDGGAFQTKTDDQGRFLFPQVPPGNHELVHLVPGWAMPPGGNVTIFQHLQDVTIQPGETTTVTIDNPEISETPYSPTHPATPPPTQ